MSLRESLKEIGKHGSIYLLAWVFNTALRLGFLPVFTRYLDRAEYGTLSLLDSAIELIRILCALGIGSAMTRFFHDQQDIVHRRRVVATGLSFLLFSVIITACLFYPFSSVLTKVILGAAGQVIYFQLALATVLLAVLRSGADSYFSASKRSGVFLVSSSCQVVLNTGINLYLVVVLGMGVIGILLGNLIAATLINLILLIFVIKENGLGIETSILRRMLRFGLPMVPAVLAAVAMHNLDRFFIRNFVNLAEVGLYSIAYQFPFMLNTFFQNAFTRIWGASTIYSIAKSPDASHQFERICTYYMTILTYALFAISIAADTLISIFTAPSYFTAHIYLPIIALGIWGYGLHTFVRVGVDLTKKTYLYTINYLLAATINLVLNFSLVPHWGAMGAAWATVVTYFSFSLVGFLIYRSCYNLKLDWNRLFKLLSIAVGLVLCRHLMPVSSFFIRLIIETILIFIFPVILWAIGFFTKGELRQIKAWGSSLRLIKKHALS